MLLLTDMEDEPYRIDNHFDGVLYRLDIFEKEIPLQGYLCRQLLSSYPNESSLFHQLGKNKASLNCFLCVA